VCISLSLSIITPKKWSWIIFKKNWSCDVMLE
jgi:hypothetical protein